jgi:N-acylneuraminate cytidylyltransferase
MKLLIIIPARGGSKRLPGKNVMELAGKPLIKWTIDLAQKLPYEKTIIVSTDSEEIAEVARRCGVEVPWLRPPEISQDSSTTTDVALHALNWFEESISKVDGVILLQPTTPFRMVEKIVEGIEKFKTSGMEPVVAVSPVSQHPRWMFKLEEDKLTSLLSDENNYARSQELESLLVVNGSFYIISPIDLREQETFFAKSMKPLIIDSLVESLDIDTQDDLDLAEFYASKFREEFLKSETNL